MEFTYNEVYVKFTRGANSVPLIDRDGNYLLTDEVKRTHHLDESKLVILNDKDRVAATGTYFVLKEDTDEELRTEVLSLIDEYNNITTEEPFKKPPVNISIAKLRERKQEVVNKLNSIKK